MAAYIVVDIQGFLGKCGEYIVKEIAACSAGHEFVTTFRNPYPFSELPKDVRAQVRYLESNHHQLMWESGERDFDEISNFVGILQGRLLVKGKEKHKHLLQIVGNSQIVVDLENVGCPSLAVLSEEQTPTGPPCPFHHSKRHCALANARLLNRWCRSHFTHEEEFDARVRATAPQMPYTDTCESCGKESECIQTLREFYDGFFKVCCKCTTLNAMFWKFGDNEQRPCGTDLHAARLLELAEAEQRPGYNYNHSPHPVTTRDTRSLPQSPNLSPHPCDIQPSPLSRQRSTNTIEVKNLLHMRNTLMHLKTLCISPNVLLQEVVVIGVQESEGWLKTTSYNIVLDEDVLHRTEDATVDLFHDDYSVQIRIVSLGNPLDQDNLLFPQKTM